MNLSKVVELCELKKSVSKEEAIKGACEYIGLDENLTLTELRNWLEKEINRLKEKIKKYEGGYKRQLEEDNDFYIELLDALTDDPVPSVPDPDVLWDKIISCGDLSKAKKLLKDLKSFIVDNYNNYIEEKRKDLSIKIMDIDKSAKKAKNTEFNTLKEKREHYSSLLEMLDISDPDKLIEQIISEKNFQQAKILLWKLFSDVSDSDKFQDYAEQIDKKVKYIRIQIRKEVCFLSGEKYFAENDIKNAVLMYNKAKSLPGSTDARVYYRIGSIMFHKLVDKLADIELEKVPNAEAMLKNYYAYALEDNNFMFPEAWLDAALLSFMSKTVSLKSCIDYLDTFQKKTESNSDYEDLRIYTSRLIEDFSLLHRAEGKEASAEDVFSAALVYASFAEQYPENRKKYLFVRPASFFHKKAIELMEKSISMADNSSNDIKDILEKRKTQYEDLIPVLESKKQSFDDELNISNVFFDLQKPLSYQDLKSFPRGIDESILHMEKALDKEPQNKDALARKRLLEKYKKCVSEKSNEKDIAALADEYIEAEKSSGLFVETIRCLKRIRNTVIGKEKLFKVYYEYAKDYKEAESIAKELVKEEIDAEKEGRSYSADIRKALIRIYYNLGKNKEAIKICKGANDVGGLLNNDENGEVAYGYAQLCEKIGNLDEARKYYKKSADKEFPAAYFQLFKIEYDKSKNGKGDINDALNYLDSSADSGYPSALYQRGLIKLNGDKILHYKAGDEQGAMEDFYVSATKGHPNAAMFVLERYLKEYEESYKDSNEKEKKERMKKIVDFIKNINIGNMSREELSLFYENDDLISDIPKGGDDKVVIIAEKMISGLDNKIPQNVEAGIEILKAYADNDNTKACSILGEIYYRGITDQKLPVEELRYQRIELTKEGDPFAKDLKKAKDYLKKAADKNDPWASYYYALLLIEQNNTDSWNFEKKRPGLISNKSLSGFHADPKIQGKIIDLLNVASVNDEIPQAEYLLGFLHENGFSTKKNFQKAEDFYKDSAKNGFVPAMIWIADNYNKSNDEYHAMYWYAKAVMHDTLSNLGNKVGNKLKKISDIDGRDFLYALRRLEAMIENMSDNDLPKIFDADEDEESILEDFVRYSNSLWEDDNSSEISEEHNEAGESFGDSMLYLMYFVTGQEGFYEEIPEKHETFGKTIWERANTLHKKAKKGKAPFLMPCM